MYKEKLIKAVSYTIYITGIAIVIYLTAMFILGSNEAIFPYDGMNPMIGWQATAVLFLALGSLPMLISCASVYRYRPVRKNKLRNVIVYFWPGFICLGCVALIFVLMIAMLVQLANSPFM